MIAIDTNVLVRYLVEDDESQTKRVHQLFARNKEVLVTSLVIVETCWVLQSSYKVSKPELIQALMDVVDDEQLKIDDPKTVRAAIQAFQHGVADFSDYLVLALCRTMKCEYLYTFDQKLQREKFCKNP